MAALTRQILLVIEYNGACYHGFQLQASEPTIQAELEAALLKLTGTKARVIAASRTDTGVHAKGQVTSFRTTSSLPVSTFVSGLNYYLPEDIAVKAAYEVDASFNVRKDAVSREYDYYILESKTRSPLKEQFSYRIPGNLNLDLMNGAGQLLMGRHDFASFASSLNGSPRKTIRDVYRAEVKREGDFTVFNMVANSFLPHQIRNTIGALIRVGLGKMTIEEFRSIIESKKVGLAGPAAPAKGLFLMKINYPVPIEEKT